MTRDNRPAYLADDIDQLQHQHQEWLEKRAHVAEVNALRDQSPLGDTQGLAEYSHSRTHGTRIPSTHAHPLSGANWHGALKGALKVNPAVWQREYTASFEAPGRFFPATARFGPPAPVPLSPRGPEALKVDPAVWRRSVVFMKGQASGVSSEGPTLSEYLGDCERLADRGRDIAQRSLFVNPRLGKAWEERGEQPAGRSLVSDVRGSMAADVRRRTPERPSGELEHMLMLAGVQGELEDASATQLGYILSLLDDEDEQW